MLKQANKKRIIFPRGKTHAWLAGEMTRVVDTMVKASNPVPRQEKLMLDEKEKCEPSKPRFEAVEKQFGQRFTCSGSGRGSRCSQSPV
jgi:hypothetical protein